MKKNLNFFSSSFEYNMLLLEKQQLIAEGTKASVADPFWFLARQWQTGEFRGSNGGSPLCIKVKTKAYDLINDVENINLPLQVIIESGSSNLNNLNCRANDNAVLNEALEEESLKKSDKWNTERLEYDVELKATTSNTADNETISLVGKEYQGQGLDWYTFDIKNISKTPNTNEEITTLPSLVTFAGMPNSRFWQFEHHKVDFGGINAQENFLGELLMEFGMLYSNDWFIIPMQQHVNSIRFVDNIEVKDVFNKKAKIVDYKSTNPFGFQQFALHYPNYEKDETKALASSALLFFPDSIIKSQISEPVEKVIWFRDNDSNLVWAIEHTINGAVIPRDEGKENLEIQNSSSSQERHFTYIPIHLPPVNYIPYLPVQISSVTGEMKLRRGRTIINPFDKQYKSKIVEESSFVFEEEIPGLPMAVTQNAQLAVLSFENNDQARKPQYYLWIGRKNNTSSKIAPNRVKFDSLI